MRPKLLVVVLAIMLILLIIPILGNVQAIQAEATITLDQDSMSAETAPNQKANVTFTGTVHCDISGLGTTVQKARVELFIIKQQDWSYVISPNTVMFDSQIQDQTINISITVPSGTNCNVVCNFTVSGTGTITPNGQQFGVNQDSAEVYIKPFYKIEAEYGGGQEEIKSGESVYYFINVRNCGNGYDTAYLSIIKGVEELKEDGFEVDILVTEIGLSIYQSDTFMIDVKAPDEIKENKMHQVDLRVGSRMGEATGKPSENEIKFYIYAVEDQLGDEFWQMMPIIIGGILILFMVVVAVSVVMVIRKSRKK
jgi:hypothetical protein